MRLWSRLCNLVPAIIVENLLWSTLFLVGVLNVLTWIVFSSYLVSDIFLFPVFVWKVVEGVFCLVLLLFYTAAKMLIGKLFWYFSSSFLYRVKNKNKHKPHKQQYAINNNNNNYNYDCNLILIFFKATVHVLVYYTLLVVIIICIMFVKLRKCWRML